jgi:tRNA threonylcarbamoyladenosine biosynthesis protein TsaE
VRLTVDTPEAMSELGEQLAADLRAGDLVVLSGQLGAGKTTLAQGIGRGLGVTGAVLSPTFVIARVHRGGRLPLVHVDAYRLSSIAEVDDLDLDASLEASVTVVEWGEGLVEDLAGDRLHVTISRPVADGDETRTVEIVAVGPRWADVAFVNRYE